MTKTVTDSEYFMIQNLLTKILLNADIESRDEMCGNEYKVQPFFFVASDEDIQAMKSIAGEQLKFEEEWCNKQPRI